MSGYRRRENCGCSNRMSNEYVDENDDISVPEQWNENNWDDNESKYEEYGCDYPSDGENVIEQLQKEAELELEKALKILRATERVISPKKSPKKARDTSNRYQRENCQCEENFESDIPRRRGSRQVDCPPKKPAKSCIKSQNNSDGKNFPRKPKLTNEEIKRLLEAEKCDVDLALSLASDAEEIYKKPCPKQQKAKQSIKEMVGMKTGAKENISKLIQFRELMELEPEDMSPDMIATIIFSQEKGVLLDSSPHHTVQHLFPDKNRKRSSSANKDELGFIYPDEPVGETEGTEDVKSQEKRNSYEGSSEFYTDAAEDQLSQNEEPRYLNKVQFRGSTPNWFPGYLAIFPDRGENIHFAKSPSEVFQKAWKSATPSSFPAQDVFIIQ